MDIVNSVIRFLESFHLEEDLFSEYETDYISKNSYAYARRHTTKSTTTKRHHHHNHHHQNTTSKSSNPISANSKTPSSSTAELKSQNKSLKKRVEELEDDLISASKMIERQRELRGREEVERGKAEERNKALEKALKTVREGYEGEIGRLREERRVREVGVEVGKGGVKAKTKVRKEKVVRMDKQTQAGPSSPSSTIRSRSSQQSYTPRVQSPLRRAYSHQQAYPSPPSPQITIPSPVASAPRPTLPLSPKSPQRSPLSVHTPISIHTPRLPTAAELGSPIQIPSPQLNQCHHGDLLHQLRERDEELQALRQYIDKTDDLSTLQIVQLVQELNSEIQLLAATIADRVPFKRPWEVDRAFAFSLDDCYSYGCNNGNGNNCTSSDGFLQRCCQMLEGGVDFSRDSTVVDVALRTWLLRSVEVVFDRFLFGLDDEEDGVLAKVYGAMLQDEQISVAARWRRLARIYARTSDPTFAYALQTAINHTKSRTLHGIDTILRFAGHNLEPISNSTTIGTQPHSYATFLFSDRVDHVIQCAVRVANALAENVISAHYGLVSVEPGMRWNAAVMESVDPLVGENENDTMAPLNFVVCMMGFGIRCTKSFVAGGGVEPQKTGEETLLGSPRALNGEKRSSVAGGGAFSPTPSPHPPRHPHQSYQPVHTSVLLLKPEVLVSATMEKLQSDDASEA